jgi:hypothetical protein
LLNSPLSFKNLSTTSTCLLSLISITSVSPPLSSPVPESLSARPFAASGAGKLVVSAAIYATQLLVLLPSAKAIPTLFAL